MIEDTVVKGLFARGTCGATLSQNLMRSLSLQTSETALSILSAVLDYPLIRNGLLSMDTSTLLEDLQEWPGESDPQIEYRHIQLAARAFDQLGMPWDVRLDGLVMNRAYNAGDSLLAEETAKRILKGREKSSPQMVQCHNILARLLADRGDFNAAAEQFAKGARVANQAGLDDKEWDQLTNYLWCLQTSGDHLMALRIADRAERVARGMNDQRALAKTLLDRGNSEWNLGRIDEAKKAYEEALETARAAGDDERESHALGNLGNIASIRGQPEAAEDFHRRSLAISRNLPDKESAQFDLNNLAQALWQQGSSQEAVESMAEALRIAKTRNDPLAESYAETLDWMRLESGMYPVNQPRREKERPTAQDSLSPKSQPAKADDHLEAKVRSLLNEQKTDVARQLVEQHLEATPEDVQARSLYAVLLTLSGEMAAAREQLERATELQPAAIEPHLRLVDLAVKTDDLEGLLGRYEGALANDPFDAAIRSGLAMAYCRSGRWDDAIQQALESNRLKPDEELTLRVLAETQAMKAKSLLASNWDGAWLVFQDCASTLQSLLGIDSKRKGQWLAYAAGLYESFALESHQSNPPLMGGLDAREIEVLACAAGFYDQAQRSDSLRSTTRYSNRIGDLLQRLAAAPQLTASAGHLISSGHVKDAIWLLILSLSGAPDQAEAHYQMARAMFRISGSRAREAALDSVHRALELEPDSPVYQDAERFFRNLTDDSDHSGAAGDERKGD